MAKHPGKFEACADQELAERLYEASLDGSVIDQCGDASEIGWWAGVVKDANGQKYILIEDSSGFVTYTKFTAAYWYALTAESGGEEEGEGSDNE